MGVSSSQPVPEPLQRPKMDDAAASQQLLEEAGFTPKFERGKKQLTTKKGKQGKTAVKSFSLGDIQAFIDNDSEDVVQTGSLSTLHEIEVPDSQTILPAMTTYNPPMSPPMTSSIAIPASMPKKVTDRKSKRKNNFSDDVDVEIPAILVSQSTRKRQRGKYHTEPSPIEDEPVQPSDTSERNTTTTPQSGNTGVGAEQGAASSTKSTIKRKKRDLVPKKKLLELISDDDVASGEDAIPTPSKRGAKPQRGLKKVKPGLSKKQTASNLRASKTLDKPAEVGNASDARADQMPIVDNIAAEERLATTPLESEEPKDPIQVPGIAAEDPLPSVHTVEECSADVMPSESSSGEDEIPHVSPPKATKSNTKRSKRVGLKKNCSSTPQRRYIRKSNLDTSITAAERALNTVRDVHHPPDLRDSGAYTEDEDELIRRAIRDYQERKGLDTDDLVDIIQWSELRLPSSITGPNSTPHGKDDQAEEESRELWEEVKQVNPNRPLPGLKTHVRSQYHAFKSGQWTEEEEEDLKRLVQLYPGRWKLISQVMGNRSLLDVYNRWKDYGQYGESRNTSRWSKDEEELLMRAVTIVVQRDEDYRADKGAPSLAVYANTDINWPQVCVEMGNIRSRLQCTVKWAAMKKRDPSVTVQPVYKRGRTPDPNQVVQPTPRKHKLLQSRGRPTPTDGKKGVEPTPRKRRLQKSKDLPNDDKETDVSTKETLKPRAKRQVGKDGARPQKLPKVLGKLLTPKGATVNMEFKESHQEDDDNVPASPTPDYTISVPSSTPRVAQMLWGDKFDLIEQIATLDPENEAAINWDDVAAESRGSWSPETLQAAFKELLALVEEQEMFNHTVVDILDHLAHRFSGEELNQHYVPHNVEGEKDTEVNQPNTKRKRRLGKRDAVSKSHSKRMKMGSSGTTSKKIKSAEHITESDDSSNELAGKDDIESEDETGGEQSSAL
ncbi:hypothetical protein GQ44DRAFT_703189 [Phaeosphaeriaceae sp. PMI808]|nr:hypothetical protein GQ44DRAFT_703189 [Phaeosphaeriaceae sp. PMI808]